MGGNIQRLNEIRYLSLLLDSGLRWADHLKFLKPKVLKYINILKWLLDKTWGIDSQQAINFVNATVVTQLL